MTIDLTPTQIVILRIVLVERMLNDTTASIELTNTLDDILEALPKVAS